MSANFSIVRRRASWAVSVKESASSRIKILVLNLDEAIFFRQKFFILHRITSKPRLSDAFNFNTKFLDSNPNISLINTLTLLLLKN